jgi:GNAT acetyltransferase-like protein
VNTKYATPTIEAHVDTEASAPTAPEKAAGAQKVSVRVLRTAAELEEFRDAWTAWEGHPHSDIDFLRTLIASREEVIGPYVVVVSRGGKPDAMMIARLEHREVRFRIGYLPVFRARARSISSPYGQLRGNPSEENCREIVRAILNSLKSGEADVATLDYSDTNGWLYKQATGLPGFLNRDILAVPQPHHFMRLHGSFDKVFQALSGSYRQALRSQSRKTEKKLGSGLRMHCFRDPAELDEGIRTVEQVARKTYHRGLGVGFDDSPRSRQLMRFHAEQGELRLFVLFDGDAPVAFWAGVVHGGWYYSDHTGFDPEYRDVSPGNYLFVKMLQEFCANGLQGIDFGLGDAVYKQRFGNHTFQEASVNLFAPRPKGLTIWFFQSLTAGTSLVLKKILAHGDLVAKLKRRWRDRLAKGTAES